MLLLDKTLPSAEENVALDEALLNAAEAGEMQEEVLRLWCPVSPLVVLGRSSRYQQEVNVEYCRSHDVPVIRRCSGGATIVSAPSCLMYAVLLSYELNPQLRMLDVAHQYVMTKIGQAIANCGVVTEMQGTCDLTIDNRKVSGNALRCKRNWLVYHGTLICKGMDVDLVSQCLGTPSRQPEYRRQRSHADFLRQIPIGESDVKAALVDVWKATQPVLNWPLDETSSLVAEKYSQDEWNFKH